MAKERIDATLCYSYEQCMRLMAKQERIRRKDTILDDLVIETTNIFFENLLKRA